MSDLLNVAARTETGSLRMKRLRQSGHIPAVLYGHGEGTIMLSIPTVELNKAIQHGSRILDLVGSVKESALIKEVQWDAFGTTILHLDLARVSATEVIEVEVPIELKGEAPGTHEGGIVTFVKHEIEVSCPARNLPDKIVLKINELHLNDIITAGDITLPPGVELLTPAEEPIVSCVLPAAEEEVDDVEAGAEPEVIGEKADEDGEGGDE